MMMMMINGDTNPRRNPTVQVPPWDYYYQDPTASNILQSPLTPSPTTTPFSLTLNGNAELSSFETLTALQRYLPSNTNSDVVSENDDLDIPVDAFSCDDFRMYEFKVRKCTRVRSHDWTECPFAHPGEKARRRDPRKYHYSGNSCPDFRKGQCNKGDACEYAHGVFECWLHPARYRTQPCKDGTHCKRRVCFFAHTPDQLRVLPLTESLDEFPTRLGSDSFLTRAGFHSPPSSPPSEWTESPPVSPSWNSVSGLSDSMRSLQIGKAPRMGSSMSMGMSMSPPAWGYKMGYGSPRSPITARPGFMSLPATPTRNQTRSGLGVFDLWDQGGCGEEPVMERVESGRDLRAKIYAKLSKENSLDSANPGPDFGWVSELVK